MSGLNFGDACDTDFFGNPKGGGCLGSFMVLLIVGALMGYGVKKGVKTLYKNNNKNSFKTEQALRELKTSAKIVVYGSVKNR